MGIGIIYQLPRHCWRTLCDKLDILADCLLVWPELSHPGTLLCPLKAQLIAEAANTDINVSMSLIFGHSLGLAAARPAIIRRCLKLASANVRQGVAIDCSSTFPRAFSSISRRAEQSSAPTHSAPIAISWLTKTPHEVVSDVRPDIFD